jgi:NADPH-dependent glutamate synthase beta subunit-like oxidoreductase
VDDNHGDLTAGPDTGKKVAVIGSGPAGLTAAFYLRKRGHHVTVFEKNHKAGGMMRYGIPAYRLPESVLEKEIGMILGLGVDLKTDKQLGRDFDLNQLTREGFHAIFLALGLQDSRRVEIEGVKLEGVFWGVQFLTAVAKRKAVRLKPRVVVVGGGNVAVDVALTALRVGAEKVTLACLEKLEEMPASPWEIKMAIEEGVDLRPSWGPNRILGKNGRVSGLEMVHCTSVFDDAGAFCPAFDDTRESIEADQVILAIGQTADLACLEEETDCRIQDCLIRVDEKSQQTDRPGVFAGGDVTGGPGSIIEAVAAGKKAASAIDRLLDGDGIIGGTTAETTTAECYEGKREKGFADLPRVALPSLPLSERRKSFVEVDLCLTDEVAVKEAGRCLQCDLELKMANRMRQQDPSCLEAREEKNGSND